MPADHALSALPALIARTFPIPHPGTLLDYLPSPDPSAALAWIRGGGGIVGVGELLRIDTAGASRFDDADARFSELVASARVEDEVRRPGSGLVAFGSFAFSRHSPAGGTLIIPEIIVGADADGGWLTLISRAHDPGADPAAVLADLRSRAEGRLAHPAVEFGGGALDREEWIREVERVRERIRGGEAGKVVLARDSFAAFSAPTDGRRVLDSLTEEYTTCWTFAVDGFFGATPELLARRHRGLISSRVLAGTIQRTGDAREDAARAALLAQDSKERAEHAYAVASLVESLRPFAASISVPDAPFILHLPNVMHLATDVSAAPDPASAHLSSLALAARFHPTAAVCGTPTLVAAEILAEHEFLDRHRYAGPVGWIGADGDGEWGIALRSGRAVDRCTWQIFAGCGIMADSRPEAEWAETEAKFAPMRSALS